MRRINGKYAVLAGMLLAALLSSVIAAKTPLAQESAAPAQTGKPFLEEFKQRVKSEGLPPSLKEQMESFRDSFPRTVKALSDRQLPVGVMRTLWRGFKSRDERVQALLSRYESASMKLNVLIRSAVDYEKMLSEDGDPSDCMRRCQSEGDIFYNGCIFGGGDPLYCFILGEFYICVCETSSCSFPIECNDN